MDLIFADVESFWSPEYSLSKLSPLEYVMGEQFELQCLALKVNDGPTRVYVGAAEIEAAVRKIDWSKVGVCMHNANFDAYVLAYRLGINPKLWMCTLAMARPIHAKTCGLGLGKLVEHYGIGKKDNTVLMQTKGRRLADFTADEVQRMRQYNGEDTDQCAALFHKLKPHYSAAELWQIDALVRMRTEPAFVLDVPMLETAASIVRSRKHAALLSLARLLKLDGVDWDDDLAVAEQVRGELASAPKFSELLVSLGVEVPMKPSPTNEDKMIPALSKTDQGFLDLQEHDNEVVAAAARTRLDVKSTLLEARIQKFLTAGRMANGKLPIPLRYCGADTSGRDSGEEYNPQSLNRVNPKSPQPSDALRNSLQAPKGYKVIVADQSGIELRVNHFLWKVPSSVALYQANVEADLYKAFAATRYGVEPDAVNKEQRQMGKVCISEGTLIMCKLNGRVFWERVELFKPEFQLWDGGEWVWAKGVVSNGWKPTQQLCGIWLTPDHLVLSGTKWLQAQYVQGENLARALATGAENLSLRELLPSIVSGSLRLSLSAIAGFLSTRWKLTTSRTSKQQGATSAPRKQQARSGTGSTWKQCRTTNTDPDYLTDCRPQSAGATTRTMQTTRTMAAEAYRFAISGAQIARRFSYTLAHFLGGMSPVSIWTGRTAIGATPPATSGLYPGGTTCSTNEKYRNSSSESPASKRNSHVYDIVDCGPRNRFTVLTDKGPLVVHNCHLGLGFGAGAVTFRRFAKTQYGLVISETESEEVVAAWRSDYDAIVQGWKTCGQAIVDISRGTEADVDPWGLVHTCSEGFVLPSGRMIRYPELRKEPDGCWPDGRPKVSWFYAHGRHKARIQGPKADENLVQALARDSIFDCAVDFYKLTRLRPALRVHDELVYVVPEKEADELLAELQKTMRTPPKWWPELIVWSEGSSADTYGAAK